VFGAARRAVLGVLATGAILALAGGGVALGAPRVRTAVRQLMLRAEAAPAEATASAATTASGAGSDWPAYGGDLGNTFAEPASPVTAATAPSLSLAWLVHTDGEVSGNPVAAGDRVYFGTYGGTVEAVARDSGDVLWTARLDGSPVDGGMLADGGRLFVATSGGLVYALDPATGTTEWTSPNLLNGLRDALRASPKAYGGVLYESLGGTDDDLNEQGGVVALDEATGKVLWRTTLVDYRGGGAAVFSPPAIIPQLGELVVGTGNPTPFPNNPAADGDVPPGDDPYSDSLVALSLADGRVLWATQTHAHDGNDDDFIAAPNVTTLPDGSLAVGDGEKSGEYFLLDAGSGRVLWRADLTLPDAESLIVATSSVAGGHIFVGTMDVDPNGAWPANYQAPAVGRLVELDARTGAVLWTDQLPNAIAAAPVAGNGVVLAVAADGTLSAFDPATGVTVWQASAPGQIWNAEAGLTLAGRTLLVPLANPGGVAAYRLSPAPAGSA
jgi:polyvinyl alcohol dehydrogenase (cytochrome)